MCRGGGPRAQGLVRAGVVPTTPRSLERARREMSHLLVVLCRPGNFCSFSLYEALIQTTRKLNLPMALMKSSSDPQCRVDERFFDLL